MGTTNHGDLALTRPSFAPILPLSILLRADRANLDVASLRRQKGLAHGGLPGQGSLLRRQLQKPHLRLIGLGKPVNPAMVTTSVKLNTCKLNDE